MRQLSVQVPAVMILTISLTSMALALASGTDPSGKPLHSVTQPKTAIRSALVSAKVPRFKVLRTNPYRKSLIAQGYTTEVDDDNLAPFYRRRDLNKIEHEDGISERVRWKLFLARQLAMLKYREKWAS
mgnify:CR=1 FL=1